MVPRTSNNTLGLCTISGSILCDVKILLSVDFDKDADFDEGDGTFGELSILMLLQKQLILIIAQGLGSIFDRLKNANLFLKRNQ